MSFSGKRFKINDIIVDPDAGTVLSAGKLVRIPLRLMKLLCLLRDADGSTVERESLVDALWPRGHVNEEALSRAVAELRQSLGDDAKNPRFIETIPKRGYRLVAKLETDIPADKVNGPVPAEEKKPFNWISGLLVIVLVSAVVFMIWPGSDSETSLTPALLASATRLTADSGMKHHPQLSPDGQWLVFVRFKEGKEILNLISTASATDSRDIIMPVSMTSPVFDPSGSKLAVATMNEQICMVQQISVNGGELYPLASCQIPSEAPILDWSDDGLSLALVDADPATGSTAIWMMSLLDGSLTQLTAPPDAYSYDTRPRFSPDGSKLSFSRGTKAVREMWLIELDQLGPDKTVKPTAKQLSFDYQYISSHDWMPDGQALVLDSERSGYRSLWKLDLEGNWTLLGGRDAELPSISGNKLAFKVSQYESNIWALDTQTDELGDKPLIESSKYDSNPVWSPDGRQIAFSSNRTDRGSIWLASENGDQQRLIYEPPEGRVVWPSWSADGQYLVATQYSPSGQSLVKMALNRREVSIVPTGGVRPYGAQYSGDGKWLYYIAGAGEEGTRLWRQAAAGLVEASILLEQPVNNFRIVDDKWLLYTKHDRQGLFKVAIDEPANEQVVLANLMQRAWDDWTTSENWVYYPEESPTGDIFLMRKSLEDGLTEKISQYFPTALGPSLAVKPGSDVILMSRTDRAQTDLFISELSR